MRSSTDKAERFQDSVERKVRKLSAWNVFQREGLRDANTLSPAEYKVKVQSLAKEWKQFTPEQKEPYVIQATYEQDCRENLAEVPLGLKGEGKSELELQVGRKGCSKLSSKRLAINQQQYSSHPFWSLSTKFGDGALVLQKQFDECSCVLHFSDISNLQFHFTMERSNYWGCSPMLFLLHHFQHPNYDDF